MTVPEEHIKLKIRGREIYVLGAGKREILVSKADTKRKALQQLAQFVEDRCAELGI